MIRVSIDGRVTEVEKGSTILDACNGLGIEIPTLCHLEHLPPEGSCRMCCLLYTSRCV